LKKAEFKGSTVEIGQKNLSAQRRFKSESVPFERGRDGDETKEDFLLFISKTRKEGFVRDERLGFCFPSNTKKEQREK
jgi:hypothetical protein